ncbi:plant UBX domain-containing protein 10 isoform X2 [Quercus suber]|uniref:plant UBX domain-containing protein 10 isoform X2 n=1 Tax=Quercus suber TaxID=58331 RepID=UPI000CE26C4C|nr:plant UBX domain-containing protein 10-like isoform X2 [Quercus suber]
MSSILRDNRRAGNALVRRMVSLPRNIIGGFSRAMGHGRDLMGIGGRRNQHVPSNYQLQHPEENISTTVPEEWAFLTSFEDQYGSNHPFFYACQFMEALKIAEDDQKFMFVYLHAPEHPFTPSFCRDTLCSELVVQFLDANFVCWGALANREEGLQMATILRPASFPFCAVIAPAPADSIAVLQQMEGPISPAELVEILQRTMEEKGLAFGSARAKQEEKIRADRRLREEQDAAYLASLQIDKILIRFPNGERREQSFASTDKVQSIYRYIDSLGLPGIGNYRLISSFPRKVYGVDQMGMTLKDSGLHPRASLFLEAM